MILHDLVGKVLDKAAGQLAVCLVIISRDNGRPFRPGLRLGIRFLLCAFLFLA